jgi:tripartite ATP-independent transporter DctM subunit
MAPQLNEKVTWRDRLKALKEIFLPTLLVVMVLGSIFLGIATPTEAAAVGSCGSLLICIIYRKASKKVIVNSCIETLKISGMALCVLVTATLFGVFYTSAGAQGMVMDMVSKTSANPWLILIIMQVILLMFGMFMDDYAVVTICAPIFVPIATLLGFDPIWFAIIFILNMQVAYLTPPFGWALILMRGVAPPGVKTRDIWRAVPPFVAIQIVVLILTMLFSDIALWLPDKMF